jgi:uncharacterized protein (UPF0332 family)
MDDELETHNESELFLFHAQEMLAVAKHSLQGGFYSTAINRAYYAIFYAANALLATRGLARGKHSMVLSVFRKEFVKTGLIAPEFSRIYGQVMDDRHISDYEITALITEAQAHADLADAERFVECIQKWLRQEGIV